MEKTDWKILKECFNEKMPDKANRYEKILLIILMCLGSLWIVALVGWGMAGFYVWSGISLLVYALFKISYTRRTGEKVSLAFSPKFTWGGNKRRALNKK